MLVMLNATGLDRFCFKKKKGSVRVLAFLTYVYCMNNGYCEN